MFTINVNRANATFSIALCKLDRKRTNPRHKGNHLLHDHKNYIVVNKLDKVIEKWLTKL